MKRSYAILAMSLVAISVVGCSANDSQSPERGTKPSEESAPVTETKQEKKIREFEAMLIDPPADMIEATGCAAYPGCKVMPYAKSATTNSGTKSSNIYIFFTNDDGKKVQEFYLGKLVESERGPASAESAGVYVVKGKNSRGESVSVQSSTQLGKTTINYIVSKNR